MPTRLSPANTIAPAVSGIFWPIPAMSSKPILPTRKTIRAEAHEDRTLDQGVVEEMDEPAGDAGDGAERQAEGDVADLRHRGIGEHPLEVGLEHRHRRSTEDGGDREDEQDRASATSPKTKLAPNTE